MPETTAVIIPLFKTVRTNRPSSPIKASSPSEAHRQAAILATFDTVDRVIVREETVYTAEDISGAQAIIRDISDVQDDAAETPRPRAFGLPPRA